MIEMRWAKQNGRILEDGSLESRNYLQYRYQQNDLMRNYHPEMRWTDWIAVPTVEEEVL